MKLTRKTSMAALLAVAAITLAACGSDDKTTTTTPATTAPSTSSVVESSSDAPTSGATGSETSGEVTSGSTEGSSAPAEQLSGTLTAAGASSQNSAMTAWIADYNATQPGVTINYDPVGSGAGREQFLSGSAQFAGSDSALSDEELATSKNVCGPGGALDIPVYISPIAIPFNVEGVTDLNLKPAVIAQIFDKKITKWNDPAIVADNPDATLPDLAITPVNRSDDSGTSKNFQQYLLAAAPTDWTYEAADAWPVKGGEAANGTSGVIEVVSSTNGAIGYADASAVGQLPTAAVGVGDSFAKYSAEAAAAVVDESKQVEGRGEHDLALSLARDTTSTGTYPVVLVSYHLVCSNYSDANNGNMVKSFLSYVISPEGQASAAESAGSAPISDDLRTKAQAAIDSITTG